MAVEKYRLTASGGILVETGPITKIVLAILAQPEGRSVFVRPADALHQVLELRTPTTIVTFTSHGAIQPIPEWASSLVHLVSINGGSA